MSKVAHYLQEHLMGEVTVAADARRYFSTDGSVFTLTPSLIVYPRNENDVRKAARFTWQLAERGRVIPITPRGAGTDQGGAALGSGIILAFPAHMNRVLELDDKSGMVSVEPGANYGKLQQTLHTHERFLPPFPASFEYSTIGGAVANNASGEKTFKYGDTREYVRSLHVVLANGELIETGRLSKRELSKKLGLSTFEGEIYRAIDALIEEHQGLLEKSQLSVTKNSAGYALAQVKQKDGSFDLTPLFVGAQGTLGIVTEVAFDTEPYNPETTLLVGYFDSVQAAQAAVVEFRAMPELPSAIEMVDDQLLDLVDKLNPNQLKEVVQRPFPKVVLLVEFDGPNERAQKKLQKRAEKILEKHATSHRLETDPLQKEQLWKIRHSSATVVAHSEGNLKAVPIIEDGVVPIEKFSEYLDGVYQLFARQHLHAAVWGHAGDANVHMQPFLDLSQVGDRQKAFRLIDDYYNLVISLGGSTSGEHGDGRLRAPYLEKLYGAELYGVFQKVKQIFDPYGTMNPGVKINVTLDQVKPLLRQTYTLDHLHDHMPHS
ncbi:MAG TPA: FAD-linked oxidase C-terminal domain-containing protein [Candidatus Saccharimonadales bacterium]|nr:FAD-linked oxidase C-terminal domain-containing protein [Candidatus Saccharimonadales bacterium]